MIPGRRLDCAGLSGVNPADAEAVLHGVARNDAGSNEEANVSEPAITIRPAAPADAALVLSFLRKKAAFDGVPDAVQATAEGLQRILFAELPLAHVAFAEIEGRAVGFAWYFYTFSSFLAQPAIWLDDLYVDADRRGRGAGRALLTHLARLAQDRGCGRVEWTAGVRNERGLAFYRKCGASVRDSVRLCRLDAAAIERLAQEG
jgi:GNAT superfamily N-acetyltransferase